MYYEIECMKTKDLTATVLAAVLTALFLPPTLQGKGITLLAAYPTYYIYVGYTVIAVFGMFVAFYLGKLLPILWQMATFGLVGVLNTAIDFGILNFLSAYTGTTEGVKLIPIKTLAFSIALINSYFWNKGWVFEGKKKVSPITFIGVSTIGIVINVGAVYVLTKFVAPPAGINGALWLNIANVGATGLSLVWNYLGYRLVVFRK